MSTVSTLLQLGQVVAAGDEVVAAARAFTACFQLGDQCATLTPDQFMKSRDGLIALRAAIDRFDKAVNA
jgi:hypothetical protein